MQLWENISPGIFQNFANGRSLAPHISRVNPNLGYSEDPFALADLRQA